MQYNYLDDIDGGSYTSGSAWLKLVRSGSDITTYKSTNGTTWTEVDIVEVALPHTATIGLYISSLTPSTLGTATFDNVSVTQTGSTLPTGWANGDVGDPDTYGSASYNSGTSTFTVAGAGTDVWEGDDQFHMAYKTLTGDGQIVARIKSQTNTGTWAKAGIVVKESPAAHTPYASIHTTPGADMRMQWNYEDDVDAGPYTFPNAWVKLIRSGDTITTYKSSNGTAWTLIDSATITLPKALSIGLFVSSTNPNATSTATFDNVSITPAGATYSIKNFHGDTAITVGANGLPSSSVHLYDPFGQVLASNTFSTSTATLDNATGTDMAWAASPTRKAESMFSIPVIQMGARVYLPTLGRFTSTDPVSGGTDNDYSYVNDPVNDSDYSGMFSIGGFISGVVSAAKAVVKAVVTAVKIVATAVVVTAVATAKVAVAKAKAIVAPIAKKAVSVATTVVKAATNTANWVISHPAQSAGIALGAISLATGVGEAVALIGGVATVAGVSAGALGITSAVTGVAAALLDMNACKSGDRMACTSLDIDEAGLSISGAAGIAPSLLRGVSLGFKIFNLGLNALGLGWSTISAARP